MKLFVSKTERIQFNGPLELELQDGSIVRIQPGPYGKGVSIVPLSIEKPRAGPGSGKRGRKPRASTVKLRKKLQRDFLSGSVRPAPEYVRWVTQEDPGISLAVARQVVYRERRAMLNQIHDGANGSHPRHHE